MKKIINGKTYNTDISYVVKMVTKESKNPDSKWFHHKILYKTKSGNYFFRTIFLTGGETGGIISDFIEPASKEIAMEF